MKEETTKKTFLDEHIEPADEPRIGVFVCHCGVNIGAVVNVPSVVEYAKTLPNVVYAERNLYTCAEDGLTAIKEAIKEHKLNRVVVASCTPRTHAPLFMSACEEAGLNPYLFEFVNIRDQCSWVHMKEPKKASEKAKTLVRMGVAKASLLEPLEKVEIGVEPSALVIGAGISGITASLCIANQGFDVHLVEKEDKIGGFLRKLDELSPTNISAEEVLDSLTKKVEEHSRIKVYTSASVGSVQGYIGNYDVSVEQKNGIKKLKIGTIIVATGADVYEPHGLYSYGKYKNVITQLQLEELLKNHKIGNLKDVVMIQCVGSRGEDVSYCSRICCSVAIKNAIILKEMCPDANIVILHNDVQVYSDEHEAKYVLARDKGIRFVKYSPSQRPEVLDDEGKLVVKVYNELFGRTMKYLANLVILSTPLIQHEDAVKLSKLLKVPLGQDNFFFEAHVKLRPLDFATDGIYLCGTAHGPKDIPESVSQALGAASRALVPLVNRKVSSESIVSVIDKDICTGCGSCVHVCPYNAISLKIEDGKVISESNPLLCKGCGVCAVTCPARAIKMQGFTDGQLIAQISESIDVSLPEDEPNIVGFCCNWCSYAGADMAGVSRFQYPSNIRIIRVMCSGRVDPLHILWAFMNGADGVFVSGCHPADCHYEWGNEYAEHRIERLKGLLESAGYDPRRLRLEWVSASEGKRFADLVTEFTEQIKELGPIPIKVGGMNV
jgi:heterodisulfide reductase subunit A